MASEVSQISYISAFPQINNLLLSLFHFFFIFLILNVPLMTIFGKNSKSKQVPCYDGFSNCNRLLSGAKWAYLSSSQTRNMKLCITVSALHPLCINFSKVLILLMADATTFEEGQNVLTCRNLFAFVSDSQSNILQIPLALFSFNVCVFFGKFDSLFVITEQQIIKSNLLFVHFCWLNQIQTTLVIFRSRERGIF